MSTTAAELVQYMQPSATYLVPVVLVRLPNFCCGLQARVPRQRCKLLSCLCMLVRCGICHLCCGLLWRRRSEV